MLALEVTQIMHSYGAVFYRPSGVGTSDPRSFLDESELIMERKQKEWDDWVAGAEDYRRTHGDYPPPPF